jgi:O-antigen/teichoic acid export membrane protein
MAPPLFGLLLPPTYHEAAAFIPWLALAAALLGLYFIPMNLITILAGRTRWVWVATATAALVNVILNLATIPRFGGVAASVKSALSYAVLLALLLVQAGRIHSGVRIEWGRLAIGLTIVGVIGVLDLVALPDRPVIVALTLGGVSVLAATTLLAGAASIGRKRQPNTQRDPNGGGMAE